MATNTEASEGAEYGEMLGDSMVDIYIGPKRKHFYIHKELLCTKAPYFEKMVCGSFKKAKNAYAYLPEDDPDTFNLFIEWLYMDLLRPIDISKHTVDSGPIFNRVKLYCFAEKYCNPNLMDYTMSVLMTAYNHFGKSPSTQAATYVYQHTSPGALIRAFMAQSLHWVIKHGESDVWTIANLSEAMVACPDMTADVISLVRKAGASLPESPKRAVPYCRFHVHQNQEYVCRYRNAEEMGKV